MISSPGPTLELTSQQRSAFLGLVERQFGIRGSDYGAARMDEAVCTVLPTTTCTTPDELLAVTSPVGQALVLGATQIAPGTTVISTAGATEATSPLVVGELRIMLTNTQALHAGLTTPNPGINTLQFQVGVNWFFQRTPHGAKKRK